MSWARPSFVGSGYPLQAILLQKNGSRMGFPPPYRHGRAFLFLAQAYFYAIAVVYLLI
jgi:hypothetical protein